MNIFLFNKFFQEFSRRIFFFYKFNWWFLMVTVVGSDGRKRPQCAVTRGSITALLFIPTIGPLQPLKCLRHTRRKLFQIALNQTEIRLYSLCTDLFRTKMTSVWFTNQFSVDLPTKRKYNLISVWFNIISKSFLCVYATWPIYHQRQPTSDY